MAFSRKLVVLLCCVAAAIGGCAGAVEPIEARAIALQQECPEIGNLSDTILAIDLLQELRNEGLTRLDALAGSIAECDADDTRCRECASAFVDTVY